MDLDYSRMCRLCMSKDNVNIYIFCQNSLSETISETINNCLPVKIDINDSFPHKICEECFGKVDMISRFRDIVRDTNDKFNSLLSQGYFTTCSSDISKNDYKQMTPATAVYIVNQTNDPHSNDAASVIQENEDPNIIQHDQNTFRIVHDLHFRNTENIIEEDSSNDIIESDCSDSDKKSIMNNSQTDKFSSDLSDTSFAPTNIRSTDFELGKGSKKYLKERQGEMPSAAAKLKLLNVQPVRKQPVVPQGLKELSAKLLKTNVVIKKITPLSRDNTEDNDPTYYNSSGDYGSTSDDDMLDLEVLDEDPSEDYKPSASKPKKKAKEKYTKARQPRKPRKAKMVEIKTSSAFVCMTCTDRFSSYLELKDHMKTSDHCRSFNLTCEVCSKTFLTKKAMYQHGMTHREKTIFICEECGKTYTNRFSLENHKATVHGDQIEELGSVYKCKACDNTFVNRRELYAHVNQHTKEQVHLCDTCGKCFSTVDNLRSHLRIHSDVRPFPCDSCEKKFKTRLALVQHSHRHTGIKPYICDICGKTFAKRGSLSSHVRNHTGDVAVYQCHICREQFRSSAKLNTHIKFHPQF